MKKLLIIVLVILSAVLPAQMGVSGPKIPPENVEKFIDATWGIYFHGDKRPEIIAHREYIKSLFIKRCYKESPIDYNALYWDIQYSRMDYIDEIWQWECFEITLNELALEIMRSRQ